MALCSNNLYTAISFNSSSSIRFNLTIELNNDGNIYIYLDFIVHIVPNDFLKCFFLRFAANVCMLFSLLRVARGRYKSYCNAINVKPRISTYLFEIFSVERIAKENIVIF